MRYYYLLLLLICSSLIGVTGCKKAAQYETTHIKGIEFSPRTPYQEALSGNVIGFQFRVNSTEPVTSFGIRFLLPGATDYVALPEYPDLTSPAPSLISQFQMFEYALPGSATAASNTVQFKFTATTATQTYTSTYTVKALSIGLQRARLWSAASSTNYRFSTIDLLRAVAVPQTLSTPLTQDMIPVYTTVKNTITGVTTNAIIGFTSGNGTKFKVASAANYNSAPAQYATIYPGIAGTGELPAVNTINTPTLLVASQYFIAKVNRNNVFSYVGILIKKTATITAANLGGTVSVDPTQEYIEMEIKNK